MALPTPTLPLVVKAHETTSLTVKLSLFTKPLYVAVPVTLTLVVPSYILAFAVNPDIVNPFLATVLEMVATRTSVAFKLDKVILPEYGEPANPAVANNRTYIGVDAIVPAAPTTKGELLSPMLLEKLENVDTSNPEGGVIVIPASIDVPLTEKLVVLLAVPYVVLRAESVPDAVITGDIGVCVVALVVTALAVK